MDRKTSQMVRRQLQRVVRITHYGDDRTMSMAWLPAKGKPLETYIWHPIADDKQVAGDVFSMQIVIGIMTQVTGHGFWQTDSGVKGLTIWYRVDYHAPPEDS
jgi:hypothetical protein